MLVNRGVGIIPNTSYGVTPKADPLYPGLDANGNTPDEIACFKDPNCDITTNLIKLLKEDATGTGRGMLPCGDLTNDPNCNGNNPINNVGIPTWAYVVGAVVLGSVVLGNLKR